MLWDRVRTHQAIWFVPLHLFEFRSSQFSPPRASAVGLSYSRPSPHQHLFSLVSPLSSSFLNGSILSSSPSPNSGVSALLFLDCSFFLLGSARQDPQIFSQTL